METTKKSKKKTESHPTEQSIIVAYRDYVLTNGKKPTTIFSFAKDNGMKEEDFYSYFGSFEALERSIWKSYILSTKQNLTNDTTYLTFSVREKLLAFHFALAEILKNERSFVIHQLKDWKNPSMIPSFLKGFKSSFDEWINAIILEGKQTGEIAMRPFLDKQYDSVFWLHLVFILQFWSKDESANFEKTDMAIEKSVNLAFDLIGKGVLDNAFDFGKFLYQNAKN